MNLPDLIHTTAELDEVMTRPAPALVDELARLSGDLLLLGAAGKMGITLALLAQRAVQAAGVKKRVICVSRFSQAGAKTALQQAGIEVIAGDLMDDAFLRKLPDAENVIYMVGMKFGATGNEAKTWAVNTFLPGRATQRFGDSRIVLFSTGNVYPFVATGSGGCRENDPVGPVGEYAQSALGRERIFEYFCTEQQTPGLIYRLNYAIDLRYGVLLDVAQAVRARQSIDLTTGHANVIWQGDANAIALRALAHAQKPPLVLNVTGPETVSIRRLALRFGELFGVEPVFQGSEAPTALLSDASRSHRLFGYPSVSLEQMIRWTAHWLEIGGETLAKPTKYSVRSGTF